MAYDVKEMNVSTGKIITREYTQAEKDAIEASKPTTDEKWVRIISRRDAFLR